MLLHRGGEHRMRKLALCVLGVGLTMFAQGKPEPQDGPNRPLKDDLLDNLEGQWKLKGTIVGHPGDADLEAGWVLNHQFLKIHEKGTSVIPGRPVYEADVYVGYDNASERYVIHWIDIYGGRFSETLGYGTRTANA